MIYEWRDYNMTNGTISEKCETLYNKLNSFVTSVINRDVTPKISNLNTEVWGSNTQTGDSRIDTLESDVTSLSDSITNLADTTSWKYYFNDNTYKVRYNDYRVNVDVSITGTSASTTFTPYGAVILSNELLPKYPVSAVSHNGDVLVQIKDNDTKLYRKSMTGSSQSNINIYAHLEWDRR